MSAALAAEGLVKHFGKLAAVDGVSLSLAPGARHALIGPNGAGKTTLINLLTGVLQPDAGEVHLEGECITTLAAPRRVKRGLARTFQVTNLFPHLTVLESVMAAILEREGRGARWLRPVEDFRGEMEEGRALLAMLDLGDDADTPAARLPYGRQRLVEIALALATRPRVLLLDEPAAGIPSGESEEVLAIVASLPRDVTVLFIEHDMGLVFRFAERVSVLVAGRVLVEGSPRDVAADARVKAVYLGTA